MPLFMHVYVSLAVRWLEAGWAALHWMEVSCMMCY